MQLVHDIGRDGWTYGVRSHRRLGISPMTYAPWGLAPVSTRAVVRKVTGDGRRCNAPPIGDHAKPRRMENEKAQNMLLLRR